VNRGIIGNLTPENMNFSVASQPESPGGSGKTYRALGVFMFASPLTATFFNDATGQSSRGFWIEAFGIFAFGAYWILKTIELRHSGVEKMALKGEIDI